MGLVICGTILISIACMGFWMGGVVAATDSGIDATMYAFIAGIAAVGGILTLSVV